MGQKVNPHGFRVGVIKNWDSRWFEKDEKFGDTLVSDYNVRKTLKKQLQTAGVPKIEIERDKNRVRIFVHCAKPGMVIGRGGSEIEKLRMTVEKMVNMPVSVNVIEVKKPDLNAQLVSENIAAQLERRISFRRAVKQAIGRTMKEGAKGIKVAVGGRLGGAEIARSEHYHEGTIPLQTLRADIDYGFWEANTTYGKIGVKVWIYKGEVLMGSKGVSEQRQIAEQKNENAGKNDRRKPRNNNNRDNNRGNYNNNRGNNNNRNNQNSNYRGNNQGGQNNQNNNFRNNNNANRNAPNRQNQPRPNAQPKEVQGNVNAEES